MYEDDGSGNYYTKLGLFDINFFSDRTITSETIVSSEVLAPVIGNIYISLRNLALILMMLVVLYIGIKIMVSSVAAQQAKYKQLLVDWLVGFALLFMMHYIMSGIVSLNTIVVKMLSNDEGDSYYIGVAELQDNGSGTDSTWYDVMEENASYFDKDKHKNFITNNVIIRNSTNDGETFSSVGSSNEDYVDSMGRLDFNGAGYKVHIARQTPDVNWGKDGVIYLAASIFNDSNDNDKYKNKAIIKMNTMSYLRTVSSFGFDSPDNIVLYDNGGQCDVDTIVVMGYAILYLVLVVETIMFAFTYIKRVLQMSFLTMVAPIVAIMYPVDKIGDGKAQAFNTWFKDYLFNILIQPMHLLLYTIFIVAASELSSRNIIYAIAMYGFMIPSEKYFKKILGFEKGGSNAGGGPMSNAIGRSLAMDGLGKLTGLGPAGRHGGGGGKSGGPSKTRKVGKNDASATDSNGNINPLGGGDSSVGGGSSSSRTRRGGQSGNANRNPNGTNPTVPRGSKQGRLKSAANVLGRRISRAATGGRYSSLRTPGAGVALMGNAGKHLVRGATRVVGTAGLGAVGLMAGTATAMTTGDINNVWKGAAVGLTAGNKLSSNTFDRGADALSAFSDEISAERAANNVEYNKEYQRRQTFELLDEDLAACNADERKAHIETINNYADVTNLDSIDKVEALEAIKDSYEKMEADATRANPTLAKDQTTGAKALKYAKRYGDAYKNKDKVIEELKRKEGYSQQEAEDMLLLIDAAQGKLK